jgi:hypothetical protein
MPGHAGIEMKNAHSILPTLVCLILVAYAPHAVYAITGSTFRQWGQQSLAQIEQDFGIPSALYASSLTGRFSDYAWGQGVMSRALVAAAKVDRSYLTTAKAHAVEFHQRYWCTQNGTSGYNASNGNCGDRYYDDNAWIALALLELYELTDDLQYLEWARSTVAFCMTGENSPQGSPNGGIRWHESNTDGASVCSTAPTCLANLILYQITGIESYHADGRRLYDWLINSNLRNSSWIFHETAQGPLGYQTAVVTQAAARLYRITGDDIYLQHAQWMAAAMEHEFVNQVSHALKQTGKWGGHDMTDAYVELYEVDRNRHWLNIAGGYLDYLHANCKNAATGRYPASWDSPGGTPSDGLIDQASVARAFWKMASTLGGISPVYMTIQNRSSSRCLRLYNSLTDDNAQVVLYDYSSTSTSEMFTLTDLGNGYYAIRSWKSDKALQPYNDQTVENTSVVINRANVTLYSQQWRLIDSGNGYFNIQNRLSEKSIQPLNSGTANNTSVVTNATNVNLIAQQWQFAGYTVPTSITPYLSTDNGTRWDQTDRTTVDAGDSLMLKGQAPGSGTWSWTGPNGFGATGSGVTLQNIQPYQAGHYTVAFTNASGAESNSVIHVSVASAAKLFQHCNYTGWTAELGVGAYTTSDLLASGVINNDASSVKIAPGYTVTFFDNDNFQGATLVKTSDDDCFVNEGWNDRISSMIIEGYPVPAAYWRFNENGGTKIIDASGYGHTGTLMNMDQNNWVTGKRCGGLSFDGVDDSVQISEYSGVTGAAGRTCTAWIKTTQVSGEILSWGRETSTKKWIVRVNENGQLRAEVLGGYVIGTTPINNGVWHHIAVVTEDGACPNIIDAKLYVDGRLDNLSESNDQPINTDAYRDVQIGVFTPSQRYFKGQIDEVRIYSRPMNSNQIWQLYLEGALIGDVEPDGDIDLYDFAAMAEQWKNTDSCDGDLNCDCSVDMNDFAILASEWLRKL